MKNTGVVRRVDNLGRIVLPKEIRDTKNIPENTPMEIFYGDDFIALRKFTPQCIFCNDLNEDMVEFKDYFICKKCHEDIKINKQQ